MSDLSVRRMHFRPLSDLVPALQMIRRQSLYDLTHVCTYVRRLFLERIEHRDRIFVYA